MSETGTAIERSINREAAGAITVSPHSGGMASFSIQPRSMGEVLEFAKLLAISGPCIPKDFRNNAGACLALVLQALKWGADPYAVANKAFIVNDRVGYEAQLVNAIVNSSTMLSKRLDCVFEGEGAKRRCRVVGYIKGEAEPREYVSPEVGTIPVKNSPLWKGDPDQQLFYYASRAWARRWLPEVLLGIYTVDELTPVVELQPWAKEASPEVEARERDRHAGQSQLERFEERHAPRQADTIAELERFDLHTNGPIRDFDPDTGEILEALRPDPVWAAEFAALVPKPVGEGSDEINWGVYAAAVVYLIGQAGKADLAGLEVSKHPHLKRLREEAIEQYRAVTGAIGARVKELAAG